MTAEIAIMNKTAIALAADSAVTITNQKGLKIYNSVNKLFTLSKYEPIGIMIYGNAQLMDIPWETIIKVYRKALGKKKFATLQDYADNFIGYLDKKNALFPEADQRSYFGGLVAGYFRFMRDQIDQEVEKTIKCDGKINNEQISSLVTTVIRKHRDDWDKYPRLKSMTAGDASSLLQKYEKQISEAKEQVFEKIPISNESMEHLRSIAVGLIVKDNFQTKVTGVVIAGFGETDVFPSLYSFLMESVVNDRLKYKLVNESQVTTEMIASVIPFAQSEMVATFMTGIDPSLLQVFEGYLSEIFKNHPDTIVDSIEQLNDKEKEALKEKVRLSCDTIFKDFQKRITQYQQQKHIGPVTNVVSMLPKDELAAMAESLVNLTSFKRKVSLDAETVGGPIDVAVISKGDGFVWIKRKHYFDVNLNPQFLENYFRNDDNIAEEKKYGKQKKKEA